jgi:hypothetical protein
MPRRVHFGGDGQENAPKGFDLFGRAKGMFGSDDSSTTPDGRGGKMPAAAAKGKGGVPEAGKAGMTDKVKDVVSNHGVVILVAVSLLILVVVIIWLVGVVRGSKLSATQVTTTVLRLDGSSSNATLPYIFDASKLPASNGQEFTIAMWIYLADYEASDRHRLIFRRGGSSDQIGMASPIIFLDRATNRLHVALRTNQSAPVTTLDQVMSSSSKYITGSIEYLPLQRWVQIAVAVQDSVLTIFMDGELYSVTNITDAWSGTNDASPRAIFNLSQGSIYIGDRAAPSRSFISNVQFYSYAMSQRDVAKAYAKGPIQSSWLSALGLSMYGMRSPIYKLSDE